MSFWRTYYHIVWATKNRAPLIKAEFEATLYQYLVFKAQSLETRIYAINGWFDHVHIVGAIPPKHAVAHVVKQLKGASAHYLNHVVQVPDKFAWQRGYGVFTLGERQRANAEAYVAQQKQHHMQQTVNAWLERTDAFDEGPPDAGLLPENMAGRPLHVKEPAWLYDLIGDGIPF